MWEIEEMGMRVRQIVVPDVVIIYFWIVVKTRSDLPVNWIRWVGNIDSLTTYHENEHPFHWEKKKDE